MISGTAFGLQPTRSGILFRFLRDGVGRWMGGCKYKLNRLGESFLVELKNYGNIVFLQYFDPIWKISRIHERKLDGFSLRHFLMFSNSLIYNVRKFQT